MTKEQLQQAKVQLFDLYFQGCSLPQLAELAARLLNNPVVVVDAGYRVLACAGQEDLNDLYWQEYIQQGFCTYEYIALVNTLASVQEGRKSSCAYRVYCQISDNYKLVCSLISGGATLGNIILFEANRSFTLEDYTLLEDVARMVSQKLGTSKIYRSTREVIGEDLLYSLLEERCGSLQEMEASARQAGVTPMEEPYLLVFDMSEYRPNGDTGDLKRQLHHNWGLAPSLCYNVSSIVTICNGPRLATLLPDMEAFCREHGLYLGVSRKIRFPLKLRAHFQEARKVVEAGRSAYPERRAWRYHEVAFFLELPCMSREEAYDRFCYPELKCLLEFDEKSQGELYHTFYTYMLYGGNVQKTAAALYIHRNTVRYRVNQIARVAGIDFADANHLGDLFLACRILRYLLHRELDEGQGAEGEAGKVITL